MCIKDWVKVCFRSELHKLTQHCELSLCFVVPEEILIPAWIKFEELVWPTHCLCFSLISISMTACSSILALGMMPLCLLIYTSVWTSADTIQIPYDSIGQYLINSPYICKNCTIAPCRVIVLELVCCIITFVKTLYTFILICIILKMHVIKLNVCILRYHFGSSSYPNCSGNVF